MHLKLHYETLPVLSYPLVNKFYKQNKARGLAKSHEYVWVARDESCLPARPIIAACRFIPIPNEDKNAEVLLLVGVYVQQSFRNNGIAKNLIQNGLASFNTSNSDNHNEYTKKYSHVYTFPYKHLIAFYNQIGFEACDTPPQVIESKLNTYQNQGRDVIAMHYSFY